MIKRCINSFVYSTFFGILINLIIELVVRGISGFDYSPITPEFRAYFPSETMAVFTDALLYGVIGFTFSFMLFIYNYDRLGFVVQNIIYYISTSIVWMPIIIYIWQLQKYLSALIFTLTGFVVVEIIMTIIAYNITKKNIAAINMTLVE